MQQSRGRKRQISLFPVAAAFHHHRSSPPSASRGRRNRRRGGRNVDSSRGRANTRGRRCREEHVFYSTFCLERDKIPNQNFSLFPVFQISPPRARLCASGTYYSVVYTQTTLWGASLFITFWCVLLVKKINAKAKRLEVGCVFFSLCFFSSLLSLLLALKRSLDLRFVHAGRCAFLTP